MAINTDFVVKELLDSNFEILDIINDPESEDLSLKIIHDVHPDIEIMIRLITRKDDEDVMEMVFDGPDEYTDEEAKMVLQEVMDFLVESIEKALKETPTPIEEESSEDTLEDEANGNN